MRTYFFGDIHGNTYALDTCLKHIDAVKPDAVICLGDLVGWLPFGDRTLTRMRSLHLPTVAGNHDLLVAGLFTDHPNQLDRMQATAYNAGLLSTLATATDYLLSLPLRIENDAVVVTHHSPFHLPPEGAPACIENFNYLDDKALEGALNMWRAFPQRIIFSGHDHVPAVYELPDRIDEPKLKDVIVHRPPEAGHLTIETNPDSRYWVKAGSVGGPYRDGIPAANSVLLDDDSQRITLFRLPYPTDGLLRDLSANRFCRNLHTIKRYIDLLARGG